MKPSRRRNKGQQLEALPAALTLKSSTLTATPQTPRLAAATQAAATEAAIQASKPDTADFTTGKSTAGTPADFKEAAPDRSKAGRRKNQGSGEQASGHLKPGEQSEQAQQAQGQQAEARPKATASAASHSNVKNGESGSVPQPPPPTHPAIARQTRLEAPSQAQPSSQPQNSQQQKLQQQPHQQQPHQQQRHVAAQHGATRPAPPATNPQPPRPAAGRGGGRHATNYSAAVSGLVQNTAALTLREATEPTSPAQLNGLAAQSAATVVPAEQQPKPAAAAAAPTGANQVNQRRQLQQQAQQQGRQQLHKHNQQQQQRQQQQAPASLQAADGNAGPAGLQHLPAQQQQVQQQQVQQQGYMHLGGKYPWDMPAPPVCAPQQTTHLNPPSVDWSFHAPVGAAAPGPAPVFSRTASAGNLANQNAWPPNGTGQIPAPPQGHPPQAAGSSDSFDAGQPPTLHQLQQPQQAGAASRAGQQSTSGFVVASSPGRAGQNGHRPGGSVRPSAGILSVQMNTAAQSRPSGSHAAPSPGIAQQPGSQAPFSSGQNMGVSLASSIANNIWAVGDAHTDSMGTSAEQRPHMWASPSRNSPMRRAGGYNGSNVARQPSLSQASEIRRVAEASGLCCPITKDLMSDPVVLISDGYTYERAAITKWLERNDTSPITKAPLQHKDMVPNLTMRSAIQLLIPSANSQRLFPSQLERRHI